MIPMTFVCNTGAPSSLYLSHKAVSVLEDNGLWLTDAETPGEYVWVHVNPDESFPAAVRASPHLFPHAKQMCAMASALGAKICNED